MEYAAVTRGSIVLKTAERRKPRPKKEKCDPGKQSKITLSGYGFQIEDFSQT